MLPWIDCECARIIFIALGLVPEKGRVSRRAIPSMHRSNNGTSTAILPRERLIRRDKDVSRTVPVKTARHIWYHYVLTRCPSFQARTSAKVPVRAALTSVKRARVCEAFSLCSCRSLGSCFFFDMNVGGTDSLTTAGGSNFSFFGGCYMLIGKTTSS